MKIIKDYLDSLFLTVPITEATKQAKAELLEIMEDHYYESINEGKSENEAIGEVISEFGSIDEILAELEVENATLEQEGDEEEETVALEALTEEEVFDFWGTTRKLAFEFGLGVFLAILSISMLFLAYYGEAFFILCFFLCLIGGLFLLIYSIFKYYYAIRSMNHRKLDTALQEEASHQSQDYQKSFIVGSILGLLAIALTFPIILFFFDVVMEPELGMALAFAAVASGIYLLLYVGIIRYGFFLCTKDTFKFGLRTNSTAKNKSNMTPLAIIIRNFYWPSVIIFYFLASVVTDAWGISWAIFPLAVILQKTVKEIIQSRNN